MSFTLQAGEYTVDKESSLDSISMAGFADSGSPGDPVLPHKVFNIAVPPNIDWASLKLTVGPVKSSVLDETYDIKAGMPFAVQDEGPPVANWGDGKEIVNGKNVKVYGANADLPDSNVRLLPYSEMRKWKIANVDFYPFQYNPVSKKLSLAQSVTIQLSYNLAPDTQALALLAADDAMDDVAALTLFNYAAAKALYQPDTSSSGYAPSTTTYNYVIITTAAIQVGSAKLAPFVSHKQGQGYSVLVVTEGTWGAMTGQSPNTRADKIRKWLQDNYISMGIKNVLLIGNPSPYEDGEGDVPMKMCWPRRLATTNTSYKNSPTDYYYADLTGNWNISGNAYYGESSLDYVSGGVDLVPEVYVGRIPVYAAAYSTLDSILQKTIDYEDAATAGIAWRKSALLPMSFSDSGTDGGYYGQRLKTNYLTPKGYSSWTMYQKGSGPCSTNSAFTPSQALVSATTEVVRDRWAANDYGLVWWWGHGSSTGAYIGYGGCEWGCHLLESADVTSLDNAHPAFAYMSSCNNGYPSVSNNLQYSILKQGGIATVSASRVSYYGVGEQNFGNSSSNCGIGYEYMDNLLYTNNWAAGKALYEAKSYLRNYLEWMGTGGESLMNMFDFNLYGDPTVGLTDTGTTTIAVAAPNGGEEWLIGSTRTITWSAPGLTGNVNISISRDAGATWTALINNTPNDGTHPWVVSGTATARARFKVASYAYPTTVFDTSNANFSIKSIAVIAPNGGEEWLIGSTRAITWSAPSLTGNVNIYISHGAIYIPQWTALVTNAANDGSYPWPVSGPVTAMARIKVASADNTTIFDTSNANFSIKDIIVTSPNGGEEWLFGNPKAITWSAPGLTGNVNIYISRNAGSNWTKIINNTPNDGTQNWPVTGPATALARVKVESVTDTAIFDTSNANFAIKNIIVTAPNGGEIWQLGSTKAITWSSAGAAGDVNIYISRDGGANWSLIYANTLNDGIQNWVVSGTATALARIKVESVTDAAIFDTSNANFMISSITVTSPNGGQTWLAGSSYAITWSAPSLSGNVNIYLSRNSGATWTAIFVNTPNDGTHPWVVTVPTTAQARIKVASASATSIFDISNTNFIITTGNGLSIPYRDDMEWGLGGWTATGFWHQIADEQNLWVYNVGGATASDPTNDINPDLVTLPDTDAAGRAYLPPAFSGATSWWYGVNQNGTFIDGTFPNGVTQSAKNGGTSGAANTGMLTSPLINLTGATSAVLSFKSWWEIEGMDADKYDMMYVKVSTDGGKSWTTIGDLNPLADVNNESYQNYSSGGSNETPEWLLNNFNLTPYVGYPVMIQFEFNTIDDQCNGFRGWFIDDVSVKAGLTAAPVVNDVAPDCISSASAVLVITGANFVSGATAYFNDVAATDTAVLSSSTINVHLPDGLAAGTYDVKVANPGGKTSNTLNKAFTFSETCPNTSIESPPAPQPPSTPRGREPVRERE